MDDKISIKVTDNNQLIEVLKDILERSQKDGKRFLYQDYQASYKIFHSSLTTLVKLLEVTK